MATVVLIQASPRIAATGGVSPVRLAGGGSRAYDQLGFTDWRSGVANKPRFTAEIGFDQTGWTGGARPQTGGVSFSPTDRALLSALSSMMWLGADIVVRIGDDAEGAYPVALSGKVTAARVSANTLSLTIADLSTDLDKPIAPDTFLGTGGAEGADQATGRVKRRTWGYAFNIEGRVLDPANNVYEFGDPTKPLNSFVMVKDKGRSGLTTTIAYAGSVAATLTALIAATPPAGGAAVAPSIACVKWWTVPSGPLTADIQGENTGGYVAKAGDIAARLVSLFSISMTIANLTDANSWRPYTCGLHVDEASESVANALDRLLLPVSLAWALTGAGALTFNRFIWTGPVGDPILSDTVEREATYKPLKSRQVGYQRNHREQTDAEISAALLSSDVVFADGSNLDDLKSKVAVISSDSYLSTAEKTGVAIEYNALLADQTALDARYVALGSPTDITTAKTAAATKITALTNYLTGLSPSWSNTTLDTPIVAATYNTRWNDAYATIATYAAAITGREAYQFNLSQGQIIVKASYAGVTNAGELPRTVTISVTQGATDRLSSATVTLTTNSPSVAASLSGSTISITKADANGWVKVAVTVDGFILASKLITIQRVYDSIPPTVITGGVVSSISTAIFASTTPIANTSYSNLALQIVAVNASSSGTIYADYAAIYYSAFGGGTGVMESKILYRVAGSGGAWLTMGAVGTGSQSSSAEDAVAGEISISRSLTGLTAGGSYEFTIDMRKLSGTTTQFRGFGGNLALRQTP